MLKRVLQNEELSTMNGDFKWSTQNTNQKEFITKKIFFTLLKMVMPTGIIIVHSERLPVWTLVLWVYPSVIKVFPGLKLNTQSLLRGPSPSEMVTGNLDRKKHQLICLVHSLHFSSYWMKCQYLSVPTLNSLKCVA